MAFAPIALIIPQYDRTKYKNWWLKSYDPGTLNPKVMATDGTGAVQASRFELNSDGFPVTSGGALVVPFIDGSYDTWLFPTAAEADVNDTTNALQFADNLTASIVSDDLNDQAEMLTGNQGILIATVAELNSGTIDIGGNNLVNVTDSNMLYYINQVPATGTITAIDEAAKTITIGGDAYLIIKASDMVNIKQFDDRAGFYGYVIPKATFLLADDLCNQYGKTLYFDEGQYCIDYTMTKKARWYFHGQCAELAPFPQLDDDKIYLRPGFKDKMPGATIFAMTGTYDSVATQRSDFFSTVKPVIRTAERYPASMSGISIVMDMDVLDAGGTLTTPATDNRATGMDVGLLIDDASASDFPNLSVFGYFDKAGTVIWSHGVGDNPDYSKFGFGSTMGYIGLALLGNDTAAGDGPGLSGTQTFGFQLFGNDHHSRDPQPLQAWQTNAYGHLIKVDGKTAATSANLNGHEFVGGGWRTYSNRPVHLDNSSNLHLVNVPFEFPEIGGEPDTLNTQFTATSNTFNVNIQNSRNNSPAFWAHANFGDLITELNIGSDTFGDSYWGSLGQYVGFLSTGGGGLPRVIFTDNPASTEQGFTIRRDASDNLFIKQGGSDRIVIDSNGRTSIDQVSNPIANVTVASGGVNIDNNTFISIAGEGGVADTVTDFNGGVAGDRLLIKSALSSVDITIQHGTGNIRLDGATDFVLDSSLDTMELAYNGVFWVEVSRSSNG